MNGRTRTLYAVLAGPKRLALMLGALMACGLGFGQATDLIISEYVEGTVNNKYIEIYNGTAADINLNDYRLLLYTNGSPSISQTHNLTGIITAGNTVVYKNSSATIYLGAATNSAVCAFSGDDAIALYKISTGLFLDVFGNIGCDPGTRWGTAPLATIDQTLVRKFNTCSGVTLDPTNTGCPFPTLTSEWDALPQNDISNLGTHYMDCSPNINFDTPTSSNPEQTGAGTVPYVVGLSVTPASTGGTVVISMSFLTAAYSSDFTVTGTGVTVSGTDITLSLPAGTLNTSFTVNVVRDALDEGNDLISFVLSSSTGGITLGAEQTHDFTIVDDDGPPSVSFTTVLVNTWEGTAPSIFVSISPMSPNITTVQIQATDGPGVIYNSDYSTFPIENASQVLTITIPPLTAFASFTFNSLMDGVEDLPSLGLETVVFTIISATNPTGATVGSPNTSTVNITDANASPTILTPGDLVIVGVNANNGACSGNTTEDNVSFFCFKNIAQGTKLILTDNGYQRCSLNTWGNNEGTVEMTRLGTAIPAGKVITFRIRGVAGPNNITGLAPDAAWSCVSLNGGPTSVDLNSGGDQLFFMQGGVWSTNTVNGHNATYTGTPLYGFSTVAAPNSWVSLPPSCNTSSANSRSGLPLSVQCFSMAPTGSTAYNKFTFANILTTPLTPRDWIIKADNIANWVAPGGCAAYSAQYPKWILSPTLMITNAPFVPGLWRGTTNTDWFECKNWDDIKVPSAVTNVRIDETANQDCVVGLTPGGNANCASLIQTSSGAARNLIVQNTSSLAIGGPLTIQRTSAGSGISTTILGNSTLSTTTLNVSAVALNQAIFRNEVPGNTVTISGNFNLGTGGYVDLQGVGVGGKIFIGGNYQNDGPTELTLDDLNGTITMNGSGAQSVVTSGFQEVFGNFTVAKSGGAVTLNSPLAVRGVLNLLSGLVNTSDPSGLLSLLSTATVSNASDLSFVNGPMEKFGNAPFTFPVGKGSSLRPCGLTDITATIANSFVAEYFPITSYSIGINMEPTLHHLSQCEYWNIDRRAGLPTATVQLTWDTPESISCGVTDLPALRVARWDIAGAIWRDRENGGATGTTVTGLIPTAAVQSSLDFNPSPGPTAWTLGSITDENPLPIELISFTARVEEPWVRLDWATASERNNDYFTIERSADGEHFTDIHEEMGAGNSQQVLNYLTFDREPLTGMSYYRLRQTDFDGTSVRSDVVSVYRGIGTERPLVVFGDADQLTAMHGFPIGSTYDLMDMTGRLITSGTVLQEDRLQLPANGLQRGAYLFRLSDGQRTESVRFVY